MKSFLIAIVSIEEIGMGVLKENDRAVLSCGIKKCLNMEMVGKKFPIGEIETYGNSANVDTGCLLYIDKRKNGDLIKAVRTALTFGADGVIIPFGNNKNRPYVVEGRAYTTKEMMAAVWEIKRLAPLFGRAFVDASETLFNIDID